MAENNDDLAARVEWLEVRMRRREADLSLMDLLLRHLYAELIRKEPNPREVFAGFKDRLTAEMEHQYSTDLQGIRTLEGTQNPRDDPYFDQWKEHVIQSGRSFLDQLEADLEKDRPNDHPE